MTGRVERRGPAATSRPAALRTAAVAAAGAAALGTLAGGPALLAQEGVPRPAAGTAALILPLQGVAPLPGGGWPGAASGRDELLERFGAEIDFALAENRRRTVWVGPRGLRDLARRNPMLGVNPDRLAVEGLPDAGGDLPGSLHGQLRALSAATDARYAVVPLRLSYQGRGPPAAACAGGGASDAGGGDEDDTSAVDPPPERGRAVICLAFLDVRAARVLWRGAVAGPPLAPDSPALLATLAHRLLELFSE